MALAIQNLDGSELFGLRTPPHVKILSKFEDLGPRNGRGATWQNASLVNGTTVDTDPNTRRRSDEREPLLPLTYGSACAVRRLASAQSGTWHVRPPPGTRGPRGDAAFQLSLR